MCAMCLSPTIPPRSWWTGPLMAKVPTARMFTLEAQQAISCAAARMDSGGTSSTIIKGRQCDSPPDKCAPRRLGGQDGSGCFAVVFIATVQKSSEHEDIQQKS